MTSVTHPVGSHGVAIGAPPPFDVELEAVLEVIGAYTLPDFPPEIIPALRGDDLGILDEDLARAGAFTVQDVSVPGRDGAAEVSLLVCRPAMATRPCAALYYMHGGGMVIGTNRLGVVPDALEVAQELGLAVVSVGYRLAPEHPHPAPVEDCYAGLAWTIEHAGELGVDPARIVAVGRSAGGGLAAAVTLLARDRGGPTLAGQMLQSPMLDDRNDTVSARQMAGRGLWDQNANATGWSALLGADRGGPDVSAYAAPARATDLAGLPPTFIDVGSAETFRDEDVAFATRIWQAGGVAELHVWPGGFHGFDLMAPQAAVSRHAKAARLRWLRRLLAP
ncbi:MAG: alpha/beta hydrolase [Frankia sp.]